MAYCSLRMGTSGAYSKFLVVGAAIAEAWWISSRAGSSRDCMRKLNCGSAGSCARSGSPTLGRTGPRVVKRLSSSEAHEGSMGTGDVAEENRSGRSGMVMEEDGVGADEGPPCVARRLLRTGSSHGIPRWEHRMHDGNPASHLRLALMHAAQDFCRGGGLRRSREVSDMEGGESSASIGIR